MPAKNGFDDLRRFLALEYLAGGSPGQEPEPWPQVRDVLISATALVNLFMAYAHVAHDCHVGNHTIFGNGATLGGHVTVDDWVTVSAFSGVHQFCRLGKYAFIGGYTVVTRNALPYAKTVGNRARIYGLNSIGLERRGFSRELIGKLRRAYRHLIHHNTSRAIELIEGDPTLAVPEVAYLVEFIHNAGARGVILRRPSHKVGDEADGE